MKKSLFLMLFVLSACEEGGTKGTLSLGSSGTSSSASSVASDSYAYLEVYASLVSGSEASDYVRIAMCEVANGTPSGTEYDCPSFSYDEGLLYNSKLKFKWGTKDAESCPFIKFYPYYYRASNSAAFVPEWDTTTDCSDPENADSKHCYGGVAPLLFSELNFPSVDNFFSIASINPEAEVEISASVEFLRSSNRMVSNPPSTYVIGADRSTADAADGIVAAFPGSYTGSLQVLRPYSVVCEDSFSDPIYTLNFYLRDYDTQGPPPGDNADNPIFNDYPDWDSTLNTLDPQ